MKSPPMFRNNNYSDYLVDFSDWLEAELLYSIWFPEFSSSPSEENFWKQKLWNTEYYWTIIEQSSGWSSGPSKLFC